MAERRWQIAIGATVLLFMLLAAAFSLGVYVGENGWTREGLQLQPGLEAGPMQPGAGQVGPGGGPQVVGRIRSLAPQTVELATPNGPRQVEIRADTRFEDENGAEISFSDLRRGDLIEVFGDLVAGGGPRLQASRIVRIPEQPPRQP